MVLYHARVAVGCMRHLSFLPTYGRAHTGPPVAPRTIPRHGNTGTTRAYLFMKKAMSL